MNSAQYMNHLTQKWASVGLKVFWVNVLFIIPLVLLTGADNPTPAMVQWHDFCFAMVFSLDLAQLLCLVVIIYCSRMASKDRKAALTAV